MENVPAMIPKPKPARSVALPKKADLGEAARENLEFFLGWLRKPRLDVNESAARVWRGT